MDARYSDFAEKNPTFQNRIEAFTSGILTPDPKAIALWSMEPGRFCSEGEFYSRVRDFSGGDLPITRASIWAYCNGNPNSGIEGSLYRIGLVVKEKRIIETAKGPLPKVTYAKTPAGKDFGDAIAALALSVSAKLTSHYRSMLRIFGSPCKPKDAKTRKGLAVYKILKLLAANPEKEYKVADIEKETGLEDLYRTFLSLGDAEIIARIGKPGLRAKANENTLLLWKGLLEPIEAVADSLDPGDYPGFYKPLQFYNSNIGKRTEHIQRMLVQYDRERTKRGWEGSAEIDSVLLSLPKKAMKLKQIVEFLNKGREASLSTTGIRNHLNRLIELGMFEKPEKGFYRRKSANGWFRFSPTNPQSP